MGQSWFIIAALASACVSGILFRLVVHRLSINPNDPHVMRVVLLRKNLLSWNPPEQKFSRNRGINEYDPG